jgi:hypothetical protein
LATCFALLNAIFVLNAPTADAYEDVRCKITNVYTNARGYILIQTEATGGAPEGGWLCIGLASDQTARTMLGMAMLGLSLGKSCWVRVLPEELLYGYWKVDIIAIL